MAFAIVDDWKPEWKMWHDFQHGRSAALELDALHHTHPIYCEVRKASDADENFDLITYEKGAAVVRMLERYLGPAAFRRGVRTYIRRHREGNTVAADLWRALSEASGENVEPVARAWIEQKGYPVVSLRRVRRGRHTDLVLRQERFFERAPRARDTTRWPVPWVARVGGKRLERMLLTRARERVDLGSTSPRFVYGNAEEAGFFRPFHDDDELRALARSLSSLAPVERMGLIEHQWALVRSGRARLTGLLELVEAYAEESDADVLATLRQPLGFLAHALVPDAAPGCEPAYRSWLLEHFAEPFYALGPDPGRKEPDEQRLHRAALLALVGNIAGAPDVLAWAAKRCQGYLTDRRSLDANLADSVVALAARRGGKSLWQRFQRAAQSAKTPQEQRRFLLALGSFEAPALVDRTLALLPTDQVATQDVVGLLVRLLGNPAARARTWAFAVKRWPTLSRRMPPLLASRFVESTHLLLNPSYRTDVARFFREHPVPTGQRALRQSLERFDWYRGFRRNAARELEQFLER